MLSVRDVYHTFDTKVVLQKINLDINRQEILCLLGPSGCGKTTLLRIIAGLEESKSGDVLLDEQSIRSTPVHRRGFGFMFQDFALFPHLDVASNVAFGLHMQQIPKAEQQIRVAQALDRVNLSGFERRDVAQLSGGERQRVALARSLAPNPRFLMLDEPLGSLDAALREELIVELRSIIKELGLTALYVTHDQREAFAISDRIAVMNAGQVEQLDTPLNLYKQPTTTFVARFLGLHNIVPVISQDVGYALTPLGEFPVVMPAHALLLHPDHLRLATGQGNHRIRGVVQEVVFQGDFYRIRLQDDSGIVLTIKHPIHSRSLPQINETVEIEIEPDAIIVLSK